MKPQDYESSLSQAETACFMRVAAILGLKPGQDATIAISNGLPDAAVFDIGTFGIGDTNTFPATAIHFRATLDLYNRDRATLQRWIMQLVRSFPVNGSYNADDDVLEVANVLHFRISPDGGAVSAITPTTVQSSNSGEVPTWTCKVQMDVVFSCDDE